MLIELAWRSAVPIGAVLFALGAAAAEGRNHIRRKEKKTQPAEDAGKGLLDSSTYKPVNHVHIMDIDRSNITVTDSGRVFGRCAIAGCEEPILLGNGFHPSLFNPQKAAEPDANLSGLQR